MKIRKFNESTQSLTEKELDDIKDIFSEINDGPFDTFSDDSDYDKDGPYNNRNHYTIEFYDRVRHSAFFKDGEGRNVIINSSYGKTRRLVVVELWIQQNKLVSHVDNWDRNKYLGQIENVNFDQNARNYITDFLNDFDQRIVDMGHKIVTRYARRSGPLQYVALIY